ncbi:cyclic GMP-AMP synthase-like receptor 3 [Oculina patagonica]
MKKYIGDQIMMYCRKNSSLPISRLEYAGSVYERLKTKAADEVDIMVVLKTTKTEVVTKDSGVPGYARLVPRANSKLYKYVSDGGYINPERLRNGWFYSLVDQAVRDFRARSPRSDIDMVVRAHGPAVQLDIVKKETDETLLSVDLVPCFCIRPDSYYVAKPYTGRRSVSSSDLLWRQSFSLKEKSIVNKMDKDHGRRHDLLRIVKTIVNREPTSLGRLESYHLKTAFMHYIKETPCNWTSRNSLGEHFVGYLEKLQRYLENGNLPHYWLDGVNILEGVDDVVLGNMAYRLKRILNSEAERDQILA